MMAALKVTSRAVMLEQKKAEVTVEKMVVSSGVKWAGC
jgi:hypothetical protein